MLEGFDWAIAEIGARGMRASVSLSNEWQWCAQPATEQRRRLAAAHGPGGRRTVDASIWNCAAVVSSRDALGSPFAGAAPQVRRPGSIRHMGSQGLHRRCETPHSTPPRAWPLIRALRLPRRRPCPLPPCASLLINDPPFVPPPPRRRQSRRDQRLLARLRVPGPGLSSSRTRRELGILDGAPRRPPLRSIRTSCSLR